MKLSGWGRYPQIEITPLKPAHTPAVQSMIAAQANSSLGLSGLVARGLGRSYGDSALANTLITTQYLDHFLAFDEETGILHCASGVSFAEILKVFVPKGWFLPVTPGTQFVTVGGAIASDVHGKNHHLDGSFSAHLINLKLMVASGEILECSATQHRELFLATCGGMGLTGIILEASFQMLAIESAYIQETTWKTHNLAETLVLFDEFQKTTYSVAWIDCLSTGKQLGRSLLMLGEHAKKEDLAEGLGEGLQTAKTGKLSIPIDMPNAVLNSHSVKAFNSLYYNKIRQKQTQRQVHYAPFFYPLDSLQNWNRLYGKNGFIQYQFVLPKSSGLEGLTKILSKIAESKRGSFLAVLKAFGKGNDNYLSFPVEGYTLALDFKIDSTLFAFLNELDSIVLDYSGRLYLTKDARMSEATFKQSYPLWEQFQKVRAQYGAEKRFNSLQSQRLGL
ncbi:FAD-binding oxidoreductase [Thiomicrorhabdus arctica]|uniref:FAD-binding oxidoreductase n=1 Tax=Thiomicrorhabdus arctica TaxID=131540 RepID=UPI00037A3650|nr:FAD-binding oxidoreductase [Thiomicrorhabdus arctica]